MVKSLNKTNESVENIRKTLQPSKDILNNPNGRLSILNFIQENLDVFDDVHHRRRAFAEYLYKLVYLNDEEKTKYQECLDKLKENKQFNTKFLNDNDISEDRRIEHFYHEINAHKNKINKNLNKMEDIVSSALKKSPFVQEEPEITKKLNRDFIKAKKDFKDNQGYLMDKLREIIEESKKKK